ncbi:MAG: LacI family DNA-binding transcriptional regulator [Planctomycetota bacterium]
MSVITTTRSNPATRGQGRVLEAVRSWIDRGDFTAGDPLPTMRDVAESLEVDKGTVCRAMAVLQDDGVVKRAGRRLHVAQQPDAAAARGLLSDTLLVITSVERAADERRATSWVARVIEGLLTAAQNSRRHAMLIHPQSTGDRDLVRLIDGRPLGCVVIATGVEREKENAILQQLDAAGVPTVLFGEEHTRDGYDMVTGDHTRGCAELTRWLAQHGRRRILRYWPYRITRTHRPDWLAHRDQGFEQAAQELGLDITPPLEYPRPEMEGLSDKDAFHARVRHAAGYLAEHLLGPDPIDAILTPSDQYAYEVAAACRLLGKTPNHDVLIAGYDGDWKHCQEQAWELAGPTVTIRQDNERLGSTMVDVLLQRVGQPDHDPIFTAIPPRLVEATATDSNQAAPID